ncbi:hypothetical protein OX283_000965 [Flavobacterium sp. SUN052]|uniref:hypothetical protein n=1 Tax=Flavobacterium sp. SUN052 TaxID=3002441 RepID=UPI00237E1FF8|nr:hypothetical protein [Flavobacterium sp. SUN052]MEC4003212.1 hypothetical protein [Flavobacterium sp. SUN052]
MSKKKIIFGVLLVLILFLGWYLFIKKSDYVITFKAKTATTTLFQGIQDWSKQQQKMYGEKATVLEKKNFDFIVQKLSKEKESFIYTWQLTSVNDSTTSVSVGIKDENNSFYNRLTAPFSNTKFKQEQIKKIKDFKTSLESHLANFKVKINGEGTSEETFVAYINLKSVLEEKAQTMIMKDALLTTYLVGNQIKITGKPYLEVVKWDLDSEKIEFNYCFPIDKNTKYIPDTNVKFKAIPVIKGIKATYYGNMRTSDRAWFALQDYAKNHNLKIENKPLEHFFANPYNGGNELEWETQVIMPFEKK